MSDVPFYTVTMTPPDESGKRERKSATISISYWPPDGSFDALEDFSEMECAMSAADERPAAPATPIDTVIGDLTAGRVVQADRMRLGKTLDRANADASGHRAPSNEAFGRIAGRPTSAMATLTGRDR